MPGETIRSATLRWEKRQFDPEINQEKKFDSKKRSQKTYEILWAKMKKLWQL